MKDVIIELCKDYTVLSDDDIRILIEFDEKIGRNVSAHIKRYFLLMRLQAITRIPSFWPGRNRKKNLCITKA